MASNYGGVVWTNHALSRLKDRKLGQSLVLKAFLHPDTKTKADQGAVKYQKKIGERMVFVITKKGDDKKQLILSCWIDPPLKGSIDLQIPERRSASLIQWFLSQLKRMFFS